MREAGFFRVSTRDEPQRERRERTFPWEKLAPPAVFFAVAFAIDMLTGQRYSSVWGSIAIVASVIWLLPGIRATLAALGAYMAIWVGFNVVRAFADDAGFAIGSGTMIADIERGVFGGTLPSAWLQDVFFDPRATAAHDVILSVVHGSFFVVPFVLAVVTWWKHREVFWRYTGATTITFVLGLVGFLLLPTAPPWMAAPDSITRVTHHLLETSTSLSLNDAGGGFSFEPNHVAAMPSVHVAATVLVFLAARRFGTMAGTIGAVYAVAMSMTVVYLGEHYVLDAIAGWVIAVAGWMLAGRLRRE